MDEAKLRDKLRHIEALFAGATTDGERFAAAEAKKRIQLRLEGVAKLDPPVEFSLSIPDPWSRKVLLALLRRYELVPYRYRRQRRTTVMVRVPKTFMDETLWPEYQQIMQSVRAFLDEVTDRIIADVIHPDSTDAGEVSRPQLTSAPEATEVE